MQSTESSVCSIIAAFTSGLDIFRKLRQRRDKQTKGGKGRRSVPHTTGSKQAKIPANKSGEQLKLSKSLQRGSADVYNVYARHARCDGAGYAAGDAVVHASLAQTLLKLNSGLVSIISTFLTHGRHDIPVDYRSLTSLSDASRAEAIDALENLHNRLSRSQLAAQPRLKSNPPTGRERQGKAGNKSSKETKTTERLPELPPGVAKVTVNTSQTHLVWARPLKKRKASASSTNGTTKTNRSTSVSSSQESSAPTTPLPAYSPPHEAYPFPALPQKSAMENRMHSKPPRAPQVAQMPVTHQQPPVMPHVPITRRRDKVTPSFYSFATDSTKLGEIPMRKWTVPFDQTEADRLNAMALAAGWMPPPSPAPLEQQQKGRSRFMRLFGKGRGGAAPQQQAVR